MIRTRSSLENVMLLLELNNFGSLLLLGLDMENDVIMMKRRMLRIHEEIKELKSSDDELKNVN